jgi:hypothetical protein
MLDASHMLSSLLSDGFGQICLGWQGNKLIEVGPDLLSGIKGPYSQVASLSLSLKHVSKDRSLFQNIRLFWDFFG